MRVHLGRLLAGGFAVIVSTSPAAVATVQRATERAPVVYTMRFPAPETNLAHVDARVPTDGRASIDLMLPVWSPGFYGRGDYARNVQDFTATTPSGEVLAVSKPKPNHWIITTNGASTVLLSYKLLCRSTFVTGSWVGPDFAVINGPSTFITLDEQASRPHEVRLILPPAWKQSITSLDEVSGGSHAYRGADYDVFIDSPIVAGSISVHTFEVGGSRHSLADFGDLGVWDGAAAAATLKTIVEEHRRFLGELPFKKYVFLNAFRGGQGGLEHQNSSLLSSARAPKDPLPTLRWLNYVSHEYFHAINVKRLRPIELGPFDYEQLPRTPSLWISEGVTTYYGDLAVVRSGVGRPEDFLAGFSNRIRALQTSPGRLVQTLEQASLGVGVSSSSGVGGNRGQTVSYYEKGCIVGLLLDARIRRLTNGAKSFDDVMRLAIRRYSGARGFRPEEFVATASEVAGADLTDFLRKAVATTEELDYSEALDWFGLRFAAPGSEDAAAAWRIEIRPDATDAQKRRFASWMAASNGGR